MYIHLLMYHLHCKGSLERFEGVTVFCYLANQRACHVEGACDGRYYKTAGQQWEGVNDLVSTYRELVS